MVLQSKSLAIIEKEWFRIAAAEKADSQVVEDYIDCFETFSKHLLNRVINLSDMSGNTAIHYAISYCNFDVVSVLLDSKVCDVNKSNKVCIDSLMLTIILTFIHFRPDILLQCLSHSRESEMKQKKQ